MIDQANERHVITILSPLTCSVRFVRSLVRSFVRLFFRSFVHSFVCLSVCLFCSLLVWLVGCLID